jgi:hypothetical protein
VAPPQSKTPTVKARKKPKLSDKVSFNKIPALDGKAEKIRTAHKKTEKDIASKKHETSAKEEKLRGTAKGLAIASAGLSGRGTAGRILKAGLAGAAGGAEIDAAHQRAKDRAKKKKAKKAKTTVSQSAMAQKAQFHKKDDTKTEKV